MYMYIYIYVCWLKLKIVEQARISSCSANIFLLTKKTCGCVRLMASVLRIKSEPPTLEVKLVCRPAAACRLPVAVRRLGPDAPMGPMGPISNWSSKLR